MFPIPFSGVGAAPVRPVGAGPYAGVKVVAQRRPAHGKTFFCASRLMAALLLAGALVALAGAQAGAATSRLLAAATAAHGAGPGDAAAQGALPGATGKESAPASTAPAGEAPAPDAIPASAEDAAAQISGSQWPGVINHLLQKPLPGTAGDPQGADIHMDYPSLGVPAVDADIRAWVTGIATAFEAHLDLSRQALPPGDRDHALLTDTDMAPDADATGPAFELWGAYSISRPSDAAVSITYEIWNYAGANQGNLDILTLNYSLLTGQRLAFMDLFEKPETALSLMSDWSRKELAPRLGASTRPAMLEEGTAPLVENFSSLTLTPEGVCINFQPYQVAPWAAGIQKVEMPLEALLPAGPLLALWGR